MTDLTQKEKQVILRAFSECTTSKSALKVLKENYPDAYYYLGKIDFKDQELTEYFQTYNQLKLVNKKTDEFLELVNRLAKNNNELMWHLPSRNLEVNNVYADGSIILFIDALGVEYLSLIQHLFDSNKYAIESYVARCNLPSTTKVNTDFLEERKNIRYQKLDELKHSSTIKYPDNLIEEFNLLHEVKEKADDLLRDNTTVIITADHGSSRMAVLYRDQAPVYQSKENAQMEKYGRCCVDEMNDYSEIEGIIKEHEYWIFANYSRFAEKGAPQCEIHGGASFEEMIVPIVQISLRKSRESTAISEKITLITNNIRVGRTKEAIVRFKLTKQYPSVKATVQGQTYTCDYQNGEYNFKYLARSSGEVKVKIFTEDTKIGEFEINVIKGISKNDFDI